MNCPDSNNLGGALAEAAFLTGMARNSDAVIMTCYAPLLARIGYAQWNPDLIWFDERSSYRTPSYFVQQLFSKYLGDYNICLADTEIPCQASYNAQTGELVLMLVNVSPQIQRVSLRFDDNWRISSRTMQEIVLTGEKLSDANAMDQELIRPVYRQAALSEIYEIPPFTFSVLCIPAANRRHP